MDNCMKWKTALGMAKTLAAFATWEIVGNDIREFLHHIL